MSPITYKVNAIIIISLIFGLGITTLYFSYNQNTELISTTKNNLRQQGELLYQSIKNAMLPGEAPLAVSLFNDIKDIDPSYDIMLYRESGTEAFSDNTTIKTVNSYLMKDMFDSSPDGRGQLSDIVGNKKFLEAVSTRRTTEFQEKTDERTFFTIYKPLLNLPKCAVCHGSDHTVRGVIKISSDISPVLARQRNNILIAGIFFILLLIILTLILTRFFHIKILRPVKHIGAVCTSVTNGHFDVEVNISNNDEIGVLGDTINKMVQGLHERFQLSKFVSSSTINSIKNKEEGVKDSIALFFSDIRGFTAYSENKEPEEIVENLNKILNFQTKIIHDHGGDVDKYVGDEIVAIFSGENKEFNACCAARKIQMELDRNSAALYDNLEVGIGINSGEVILGMIGSDARADFTVIGDHVNFASRLCSAAKVGQIIISESVRLELDNNFIISKGYGLKVKGKVDLQRVYKLEFGCQEI